MKDCLNNAVSDAITFQREMAEKEAINSQKIIEAEGHKVIELTEQEHTAFLDSVSSQHKEAQSQFGNKMFQMLPN